MKPESGEAFGQPKRERRRQADRTAAMRARLMAATVECLEARSFAGTTVHEITERAGVTRGAVFHHFPTGKHLVAEAALQHRRTLWLEERAELATAIAAGASLEEQLRISWSNYRRRATVESDFILARRGDPELARIADEILATEFETADPPYNSLPVAWATVPGDPDPLLSRFVVGYFLTGMQVLEAVNSPGLPDRALKKFARFLEAGLAAIAKPEAPGATTDDA